MGGLIAGWRSATGAPRACLIALGTLLFASLASGCFDDQLTTRGILEAAQRRREESIPLTATPAPPPPTTTPTVVATRTPLPGRELAHVVRVWDGNSILIGNGYSVRYIGADTPGGGMFGRPLEPFGREAAERSVGLVEGRDVEIESDVTDVDADGLLLRYVYVDGLMVNETVLREGLARLPPLGANVRHAGRLRAAEEEARRGPLRLWTLPTPTPSPTPPPTATLEPSPTPPGGVTRFPTAPGVVPEPAIRATRTPEGLGVRG